MGTTKTMEAKVVGPRDGKAGFFERFRKLALGEKIILIAAPLLLLDSFLPWYKVSYDLGVAGSGSVSRSGLQSPGSIWSILAVLMGLIMAGTIAAMKFGNVTMPALPAGVTWARVQLGLAVAAAVFILLKIAGESSHLSFGFFIGIILVAALCAGGGLLFQAESKGTTSSTM
jgi:hypothetical protein